MSNDLINSMTGGSSFSLGQLEELNAITTRAFTRLADIQISYARVGIKGSVEQAKLFTGINDYDNLLSAESELATRYSDQVMGLAREATDLVEETRGDLMQWFEKRVAEAGDVIKDPAAAKPAAATKTAARKKTATRPAAASKPRTSPGKPAKTKVA